MAKDIVLLIENEFYKNKFLKELYERTRLLPFKAENGNHLIVVDLSDTTKIFQKKSKDYFQKNMKFKLHIIGPEYYLEVLNHGTYFDAYYN